MTNSLEKTPTPGKTESKRTVTEDKIVGCHHQLNAHEFEQTPADSEGHAAVHRVAKS